MSAVNIETSYKQQGSVANPAESLEQYNISFYYSHYNITELLRFFLQKKKHESEKGNGCQKNSDRVRAAMNTEKVPLLFVSNAQCRFWQAAELLN